MNIRDQLEAFYAHEAPEDSLELVNKDITRVLKNMVDVNMESYGSGSITAKMTLAAVEDGRTLKLMQEVPLSEAFIWADSPEGYKYWALRDTAKPVINH